MKKSLLFFAFAFFVSFALSAQVAKKVLLEEFTNASCPPCASQNPAFQELIDANEDVVVALKYQTQFPGFDPMNQQYPEAPTNRGTYYQVSGVPVAYCNSIAGDNDYAGGVGEWNITPESGYAGGPYGYNQAVIDAIAEETTPISITLTHALSSDFNSIEITCVITNESTEDFALEQGKLRVALTEKEIAFDVAPGSNGETAFHNVCRAMYPNDGGSDIPTIAPGESETFTFNETLPAYMYRLAEIEVVAFVQDDSDKQVYQSELSSVQALTGDYVDADFSTQTTGPTELCGATIVPKVTVGNDGTATLTSFDVSYTINGGTPTVENWTGSLEPGASEEITFGEVSLPGGTAIVAYQLENINGGSGDVDNTNNNPANQTFASLSEMAVGTSLEENNEGYNFEYPTSAVISEPIPQTGFGWGSFLVVNRQQLPDAGPNDPVGGFGESERSIRVNFYQWNPAEADAAADGAITYQKIDLSSATNAALTFDRAQAQYTGGSNDGLQVLISTDCAETWTVVGEWFGDDLSTADDSDPYYIPAASDWLTETVDLSDYAGNSGVNVQFKAISGWGNTLYLDNINMMATVGTETVNLLDGKVSVFPNPTTTTANIEFELVDASNVAIKIYDVTGKLVDVLENNTQYAAGKYTKVWNADAKAGIYLVKITTEFGELTQRINVIK